MADILRIDLAEGKRQGYTDPKALAKAANRALRWVRSPRNKGAKAPRHISTKMRLITVKR